MCVCGLDRRIFLCLLRIEIAVASLIGMNGLRAKAGEGQLMERRNRLRRQRHKTPNTPLLLNKNTQRRGDFDLCFHFLNSLRDDPASRVAPQLQ